MTREHCNNHPPDKEAKESCCENEKEHGCSHQSHKEHCNCKRNTCRKNLCDKNFSIRLAGLQDGLNFRLRQLLGCEVMVELDNEDQVNGIICLVGSNFVEMLVKDPSQPTSKEKETLCHMCDKKKLPKSHTWIFSTDKIANLQTTDSCPLYCTCHH
ncbi:hypothetical protein [Bacillus sp. Hm123]|uniref:hypothetical protein n=1 Tax=Bacillus sp. Hm123 TaxID=3450745 RepID=UPI003F42EA80